MKILDFTLPLQANKSIVTKEEQLSHFYPHLHRHSEIQLTWIIKGEGTLVTGNSMHNFQSNEIYWIGARQPHVFKSNSAYFKKGSKKKTHSIDIFFDADNQLSSFFSMPEMKQLKQFIDQHQNGFRVPQNKVDAIAQKMHLVRNTTGVEQFICFMNMLNTISSIARLNPLAAESAGLKFSDSEGLRIASVYNYVMQNYKAQITLEQVSKLAYMTPQAFCRYFKKHTHTTLVGFVNQVRVNEACRQLMENNNDTIACIAYNTGFNSITNFNRVFKSVLKKSPKDYLENYMKKIG